MDEKVIMYIYILRRQIRYIMTCTKCVHQSIVNVCLLLEFLIKQLSTFQQLPLMLSTKTIYAYSKITFSSLWLFLLNALSLSCCWEIHVNHVSAIFDLSSYNRRRCFYGNLAVRRRWMTFFNNLQKRKTDKKHGYHKEYIFQDGLENLY